MEVESVGRSHPRSAKDRFAGRARIVLCARAVGLPHYTGALYTLQWASFAAAIASYNDTIISIMLTTRCIRTVPRKPHKFYVPLALSAK